MNHNNITSLLTYHATCDSRKTSHVMDADGEPVHLSPEELDQPLQLEGLNAYWLEVLRGQRPVVADFRERAVQLMQDAARWSARHPGHPALAAMHAAVGPGLLFLMLGQRVLWHDSARGEWELPGLDGGLFIEGHMPPVPEEAENERLDVAGLLGVTFEAGPWGLTWVRLVLWPLPQDQVARMIAACAD